MKKYKLLLVLLLFIGATFAWTSKNEILLHYKQANKSQRNESLRKTQTNRCDSALLKLFTEVCRKMDTDREECFIEGAISTFDRADSVEKDLSYVQYVFKKKGNDFYYKLGETETINTKECCLFIEHPSRKIVLSKQIKIESQANLFSAAFLREELKSENYEMRSNVTGCVRTISFVNENHISCREYSLSFDTLSKEVQKVVVRLTNQQQPLGKNNEKLVEIKVKEIKDSSELGRGGCSGIVTKKEGKWELLGKYKEYDLLISDEKL